MKAEVRRIVVRLLSPPRRRFAFTWQLRDSRWGRASATLDAAVEQAVHDGLIPGAVLIAGQNGKILHRKAYGDRAIVPAREAMTVDTIFDAASLTKVIATTPSVMKLFEQGKLRIDDPVTHYLPEFQGGKSDITIRDLMTHFSGLRPDLDLEPPWSGYDTGIRRALIDKPASPPGVRVRLQRYQFPSCLVKSCGPLERKNARPEYARENIFQPLHGMTETMFKPPVASSIARADASLPTEIGKSRHRRAIFGEVVHGDPTVALHGRSRGSRRVVHHG